jgi:hypothetical protein
LILLQFRGECPTFKSGLIHLPTATQFRSICGVAIAQHRSVDRTVKQADYRDVLILDANGNPAIEMPLE